MQINTVERLFNIVTKYKSEENGMVSKEVYELIDRLERSGDWNEINELIEKIQKLQEVEK